MTNQAKRAIAKMKAAGWKRSEFKVRTDTRVYQKNGRRIREYGDALIMLRASKSEQYRKIGAMLAEGLDVMVISNKDGGLGYIHVSDGWKDEGQAQAIYIQQDGSLVRIVR
jgi:hypothetical protein